MMDALALGAEFEDASSEARATMGRWQRPNPAGRPFVLGAFLAYPANFVARIALGFDGEWYSGVWTLASVSMAIGWYFLAWSLYYARLRRQMKRALRELYELGAAP